jgi:glutathione peroxidase
MAIHTTAPQAEAVLRLEEYAMDDIDGKPVSLGAYKGKVIMLVNVASKCGFTYQYKTLEELYRKYKDRGFVILGFPANDFMWQEPGTNQQIKQFCSLSYSVSFPMFAKISVKGRSIHPLYKVLTDKKGNPAFGGAIGWNFTKFIIGKDGRILARFASKVEPDSADIAAAIETALEG